MSTPHHSTSAARAINLLTQGVTQSETARALGLTPGAISQIIQQPEVAAQLEEARLKQIERSSHLDNKYDGIEEKLLDQLERAAGTLLDPMKISRVLQTVNSAKRRGIVADSSRNETPIVHLQLPAAIRHKFVVNVMNQVVQVGSQNLVTMQSVNIPKMAQNHVPLPQTPIIEEEDEFGFTRQR